MTHSTMLMKLAMSSGHISVKFAEVQDLAKFFKLVGRIPSKAPSPPHPPAHIFSVVTGKFILSNYIIKISEGK